MERNNVLDLVVGLDSEQAQKLQALAVPVLGEVRRCLLSGESAFVIDLDKLRKPEIAGRYRKARDTSQNDK